MGCIYACQCGGFCLGCKEYEPEKYYGHAEDVAAQAQGYSNYDEMISGENQLLPEPPEIEGGEG